MAARMAFCHSDAGPGVSQIAGQKKRRQPKLTPKIRETAEN